MAEGAVAQARAFALVAEHQMGRLLKGSERAKGTKGRIVGPGRGKKNGGTRTVPPFSDEPTLEELGITRPRRSW